MERNITHLDFLDSFQIAVIKEDIIKLREISMLEMPKFKQIQDIQKAMSLCQVAIKTLKDDNVKISKEMKVIDKGNKLRKLISKNKTNIYENQV